jgi:ADP-ribose pyrophosphatase YjhB (NUDIX family)
MSIRLAVSNAIIKNNFILLIKRENQPFYGLYSFTGGKIEGNERYLEATARESLEETGIKEIQFPEYHLLGVTYVKDFMIITSVSEYLGDIGVRKRYTHNGIECQWFDYEEIMTHDSGVFVPNLKTLIPKAFELIKLNKML